MRFKYTEVMAHVLRKGQIGNISRPDMKSTRNGV